MSGPVVSIVVPVYNEQASIETVLHRLTDAAIPVEIEVIVVDDGSSDGTAERIADVAAFLPVRVVTHNANRGKGAAIRSGIAHAVGEIIVIQDGDLEYSASDIPALIAPILSGSADAVLGNRYHCAGGAVGNLWRMLGNRFGSVLVSAVIGRWVRDVSVGYKAFAAETLRDLTLTSDRFGFEPEVVIKAARNGARLFEVPVSYEGRSYADGKKFRFRDSLAVLFHIVRFAVTSKASDQR